MKDVMWQDNSYTTGSEREEKYKRAYLTPDTSSMKEFKGKITKVKR